MQFTRFFLLCSAVVYLFLNFLNADFSTVSPHPISDYESIFDIKDVKMRFRVEGGSFIQSGTLIPGRFTIQNKESYENAFLIWMGEGIDSGLYTVLLKTPSGNRLEISPKKIKQLIGDRMIYSSFKEISAYLKEQATDTIYTLQNKP